jgi:hypothetical protein
LSIGFFSSSTINEKNDSHKGTLPQILIAIRGSKTILLKSVALQGIEGIKPLVKRRIGTELLKWTILFTVVGIELVFKGSNTSVAELVLLEGILLEGIPIVVTILKGVDTLSAEINTVSTIEDMIDLVLILVFNNNKIRTTLNNKFVFCWSWW